MNTLTYEEALEIYNEMERLVDRTDEDILYLYNSLIERAIRYAHTRQFLHVNHRNRYYLDLRFRTIE